MHALGVFRQAASVHAPRALQHQFHSATTLAPVGSVDRTQLGMVLNQPCPIVSLGAVSTATVGVVPMRAMSDHREIKYRGSKNYTELRELAHSISSTAQCGDVPPTVSRGDPRAQVQQVVRRHVRDTRQSLPRCDPMSSPCCGRLCITATTRGTGITTARQPARPTRFSPTSSDSYAALM